MPAAGPPAAFPRGSTERGRRPLPSAAGPPSPQSAGRGCGRGAALRRVRREPGMEPAGVGRGPSRLGSSGVGSRPAPSTGGEGGSRGLRAAGAFPGRGAPGTGRGPGPARGSRPSGAWRGSARRGAAPVSPAVRCLRLRSLLMPGTVVASAVPRPKGGVCIYAGRLRSHHRKRFLNGLCERALRERGGLHSLPGWERVTAVRFERSAVGKCFPLWQRNRDSDRYFSFISLSCWPAFSLLTPDSPFPLSSS